MKVFQLLADLIYRVPMIFVGLRQRPLQALVIGGHGESLDKEA
jgi:hypothetical protein